MGSRLKQAKGICAAWDSCLVKSVIDKLHLSMKLVKKC